LKPFVAVHRPEGAARCAVCDEGLQGADGHDYLQRLWRLRGSAHRRLPVRVGRPGEVGPGGGSEEGLSRKAL